MTAIAPSAEMKNGDAAKKGKKKEKIFKSPDEDMTVDQLKQKYPVPFMPDQVLANTWIYRLFYFWFWTLNEWFHGVEIKGIENLESVPVYFSVGLHSTHNADIFMGMMSVWAATKKKIARGFMHRIIVMFNPWVQYLGLLPGNRSAAQYLLKSGFSCGALPGGGEEAMYGHEHAYDLHPKWHERRGFVKVAREGGGVAILPSFCRNVEEMRFNIFFFLFNYFGLSRFYSEKLMTLPGLLGWIFKQIGMNVWYTLSWTGIPVPVKLTLYIGKPIIPDYSKETDDEIAEKARKALQDLINEHQPHKHTYLPGLIERFEYLVKKQLPKSIAKPLINILAYFGIKMTEEKQKTN